MRRTIVFLALVGMLGAVAGMGALREHPPWPASGEGDGTGGPSSEAIARTDAEASRDAVASPDGAPGTARSHAGAVPAPEPDATAPTEPTAPPEPLSVVALGWEVLAPGVLANGGLRPADHSTFTTAGLDVTFASVTNVEEIEVRLGRGGGTDRGADVALMPLPAFVASYERLRALSPEVFFVVAWSRGQDALVGEPDLLHVPAHGELRLAAEPGSSPALLGVFALDQAGVSPSRVHLVPDEGSRRHRLRAVQRRKSRQVDARDLVLSTADATHLVPVVAVAPAGVLARRRPELVRWSSVWMDGAQSLAADPAKAARVLAEQKGAPEAVDLIDALGWMEFTDLHASARAAGLSGRGAVDIDGLFLRTWSLWRGVGLLTTPPPPRVPLNATVIADLAREAEAAPAPMSAPPTTRRAPAPPEAVPQLLRHVVPGRRLDAKAESALVTELGFLAGVFSRSTIEVWVPRSPEAAQRVADHAVERFGLDPRRVVVRPDRDRKAKQAAVLTIGAAQ